MNEQEKYMVGIDAGGTMTDCVIADEKGGFVLGKALTQQFKQQESFHESVKDAGPFWNLSDTEVMKSSRELVYTGTMMLNTILTRTGKKMGFLVTRGQERILQMERGLTWLGFSADEQIHQNLKEHTPELVNPKLVKGVMEKITGGSYLLFSHVPPGKIIIPLVENDVRRAVEELIDDGVEVIGICFNYSYTNPVHEHLAQQIALETIKKRNANVSVITSVDTAPRHGEIGRIKAVLVQGYAGDLVKEQLLKVEEKAKSVGYEYGLMTLASFGGLISGNHPRMFESLISGPVGGMLGGKMISALGYPNLLCCDIGGTSFDMAPIIDSNIPLYKDVDYARHRISLSSVKLDSIPGGAGLEIFVDPLTNRPKIGNMSAGADVGVCYKHPKLTLSDVDVILGYLSPDYFLGGKVKLDRQRAYDMFKREIAAPLKGDVYNVAEGVRELLHSILRTNLETVLLIRGMSPTMFSAIFYGGAGPLHMSGAVEGTKFNNIMTLPWAAAFSAFGCLCPDRMQRLESGLSAWILPALTGSQKVEICKPLDETWRTLEKKLISQFETEGVSREHLEFRYGIWGRYPGQMDSFEAMVPIDSITSEKDSDAVLEAFDTSYGRIYPKAAKYTQLGCYITGAIVECVGPRIKPKMIKHKLGPDKVSKEAFKGKRDVYYKGKMVKFSIYEMDHLTPGNRLEGPAIVEHPMTTLVVPPGKSLRMDEYMIIHYMGYS